jgi:hypothetical protein
MGRNESIVPGPAQPSGNGPARVVAGFDHRGPADAAGPHSCNAANSPAKHRSPPFGDQHAFDGSRAVDLHGLRQLVIFAFGPHIQRDKSGRTGVDLDGERSPGRFMGWAPR